MIDLARHQEELRGCGFTITSEDEMGFPGLRHRIQEAFFGQDVLLPVPDVHGPVATRYRSKDMMHYWWQDGDLSVRETSHSRYARIRTSGSGYRHVPRFRWFDVDGCEAVARLLISMVPPEQRHPSGAFGLHGFRSFDAVVHAPHADGFEFGGTYCVDRTCGGGVSYLYDMRRGGELVLEHQLQPGEILLFHERFAGQPEMLQHGATRLEGSGYRDALVIQLDAPEDLQAAAEERGDLGDSR